MKAPVLALDTKDDRQEIHNLLGKLHPYDAIRWLDGLCRLSAFKSHRLAPSKKMKERAELARIKGGIWHDRLVNEIYGDVWMLTCQHNLDLGQALQSLERLARRKGVLPPACTSLQFSKTDPSPFGSPFFLGELPNSGSLALPAVVG